MNTVEIKLAKKLGRPATEDEIAQYKKESYIRNREKIYAWRKKKNSDPEYWANYLTKCKEWHRKRQERKGRTVRIQPKHETEESRLAARKASREKYINKDRDLMRSKWRNYAKKYRPKQQAYQNSRRKTDPLFSISGKLRKRLRAALYHAGARKGESASVLAGCSMLELKQHLESQFTEGMSWELFCTGAIHIDHHVPCAAFDLTKEDQQKACFHYTNLKPSWPVDNLTKSSVYNGKRWYYSDHMPAQI